MAVASNPVAANDGAPKPNLRQMAKAATRAKVIAAAQKLWAEPGTYEIVGIREIAAETGMSTGAVFANFDSKADLWVTAMGYAPPVDCRAVREALIAASARPQAEAA